MNYKQGKCYEEELKYCYWELVFGNICLNVNTTIYFTQSQQIRKFHIKMAAVHSRFFCQCKGLKKKIAYCWAKAVY